MLWSVWSWRQDAIHHGGFGVPWTRASHMTGGSGRQPDWHRKKGLCRWRRWYHDTDPGLGHWALWFRSRECNAERLLLVAGSWDCVWRHSNRPWGSFYVLLYVSRQNTVAILHIDKSVWPDETSRGSLVRWSRHLTPWKHLSGGWYNPVRRSFYAASGWHPGLRICFLV